MTNLQSKAMLVSLNLRSWRGTVKDNGIARDTERSYEAEEDTLTTIKKLTPRHLMQPIDSIINAARQEHYRFTVPGLIKGQQLLASRAFEDYCYIHKHLKDDFFKFVDQFTAYYPKLLADAPRRLGKAYKEEDFPPSSRIRGYFDYRIQFAPVPEINDWRLDGVDEGEVSKMRNEVEDEVRIMYRRAIREVYERAREILANVANQAKEYKGGPGDSRLRDATIRNLKDISALVLKMNVTGDKDLDQLGYEMVECFADAEASNLRSNEKARTAIAEAAERLLKRIPK
jgi:hypothetical protein